MRISSKVTFVQSNCSIPERVMREIESAISDLFEFRARGMVCKGSEVVQRAGRYFIATVKSRFSTSKRRGVKGMLFHVTVTICKPVFHHGLVGLHKIGMVFEEIKAEIGATATLVLTLQQPQYLEEN